MLRRGAEVPPFLCDDVGQLSRDIMGRKNLKD
jgi:hypothetical protein